MRKTTERQRRVTSTHCERHSMVRTGVIAKIDSAERCEDIEELVGVSAAPTALGNIFLHPDPALPGLGSRLASRASGPLLIVN